ncbi:CHAT domain-containing protein [Sorangium sp. So ce118]
MSDPGELVLDLELRRFKNFAEANVQTARGKRNRIAIGWPLCKPEGPEIGDGLLETEDLIAYPIDEHSFFRLRFDITLLPDHDCRFVSADLVLVLETASAKDNVPLFLRLDPVDGEAGARLSGFGTGTREAGWRFERTEAAAIPLGTRGLEVLVVLRRGAAGKVRFRLAAKIDVRSTLDRWMTLLFSRGLPAIADYEFPAASEADRPSTAPLLRRQPEQDITERTHRPRCSADTSPTQPTTVSPPGPDQPTRGYSMDTVKILFLSANPVGTTPLRLDEEAREIETKLRMADRRNVELITKWAVRPDDLLQHLNQHKPHVVHFSGHGSPAEELILLDKEGHPKPVSKKALMMLFRTLKDNIRVVVLNACFSRPQAEAIVEEIDCAVGMNRAIRDDAAIGFAASFYRAIGFGRSVQEAFDQGRTALLLEGIPEEHTPELMSRPGIEARSIILAKP